MTLGMGGLLRPGDGAWSLGFGHGRRAAPAG